MAKEMMLNFSDFSHPIFRDSGVPKRGELQSKGRGKNSILFNDGHENIELLFRTVISENQLSVYGAITDLCNELPKDLRAPLKPAAFKHLQKCGYSDRPVQGRKFYQCTATEKPDARRRSKIRTIVTEPEIFVGMTLHQLALDPKGSRTRDDGREQLAFPA